MRSALAFVVVLLAATVARAELPRPVARAFLDAGVPLSHVAVVVQRVDARRPLFAHQPDAPMNPASTMKLVTTFAALELLGPDYRWRTEAHLGGELADGTLHGDLILKGYGDPKITIDQWRGFMADLRAKGIERIEGDLVLDRSHFAPIGHDPAAFDAEPLRPYNVGPDALLVNFKSVRFAFEPNAAGDAVDMRMEPSLPQVALGTSPTLVDGDCGNWRRSRPGRSSTSRKPRSSRSRDSTRAAVARATGTSRCSITRPTSTACSPPISPRPAARSGVACAQAGRRRPSRSPRSRPCPSTT